MTMLLDGFEPSEADMVQAALAMPLERKIEKAILFYREFCDGAYGAFSGGKDSCVIKQLGVEAGVQIDWHYNNVTIDPPELVRFIKQHHQDVRWNNPRVPLLARMVEKAEPPTRINRWCCKEYKEVGGYRQNKIIGVRVAESSKRAKIWKMVKPYIEDSSRFFFCPIVYWTDQDVWAYIRSRNLPYCSLYDEGFDRLGCIGCPQSRAQRVQFERWPRYEQMWRKAFQRTWDKWHGVPNRKGKPRFFEKYGSPDAFFEWWISGEAYQEDGQCVFEDMMEQR